MMSKKKKSKKLKSAIYTIILAVVVISIFTYLILTENKGTVEGTSIVMVNGEPITDAELESEFQKLPPQYQSLITKEDLLDQIIDRKLLFQEAESLGIDASEDEIDEQLDIVRQQFPTEEIFLEILDEQNLSIEDIKDQIKDQIIINKLLNKTVFNDIEVSVEEIEEYYDENIDQFKAPSDNIRASHILVESSEDAKEIIGRLKDGEEFEDLAVEYSIDPSVAVNKGDLGFFSEGMMVEEFEKAAFSLNVGQVKGPVETQFGFHIIKRLPDEISLEDASDEITLILSQSKQSEEIEGYIEDLREKAKIEYIEEESPVRNEFVEVDDSFCEESKMPIIRVYTTSKCDNCMNILPALKSAIGDKDVVLKILELDTGDNLETEIVESSLTKTEYGILKKYNPEVAVPAYVIDCKYVRIGNAYKDIMIDNEIDAFKEVLDLI